MTLGNATQIDRCHKGYYEGNYCWIINGGGAHFGRHKEVYKPPKLCTPNMCKWSTMRNSPYQCANLCFNCFNLDASKQVHLFIKVSLWPNCRYIRCIQISSINNHIFGTLFFKHQWQLGWFQWTKSTIEKAKKQKRLVPSCSGKPRVHHPFIENGCRCREDMSRIERHLLEVQIWISGDWLSAKK